MWGHVFDAFFPRACASCRAGPWPFCARCAADLHPIRPPWCERCGCPAPAPTARCGACPPESLTTARAAFAYDGPARRAVHRLKFSGWRDVAGALAAAMAAAEPPPSVEVVTWVPLARARRAERGYDQARALAVAFGRRAGVPARRLLRRTVATTPQAARSGVERRVAMLGVFEPIRPVPALVLLVDDVLTTGATMSAAAEALRAGGARAVHARAAARSLPRSALRRPSPSAYPRAGSRSGLWLPGDPPR